MAAMINLTNKQAAFCIEYMVDLNATQAAIRAGYREKAAQRTGSENLSKPVIQIEIQRLIDKRSQDTKITAEYVLRKIKDVADDCAETVSTEHGEQIKNPQAALKGYELLGKHLAIWTDKKIVDSTMQVTGINIVGVDEH